MGRVLIIIACNFAYWRYDDGSTSRLQGWDYCHLERKPAVTETVADRILVRRRARRPVWNLPTVREGLLRRRTK